MHCQNALSAHHILGMWDGMAVWTQALSTGRVHRGNARDEHYLCAMVRLWRVYAGRDDHHVVAYLAEPLYEVAEPDLHACKEHGAKIRRYIHFQEKKNAGTTSSRRMVSLGRRGGTSCMEDCSAMTHVPGTC